MTRQEHTMTDSGSLAADAAYLADQYSTAEKLRIRQEAHARYSERTDDFFAWALALLDLRAGQVVADVGCGPGAYHPLLHATGCRTLALDASPGMTAETQRQAQQQRLNVDVIQAHAEALPLRSASVDHLLANHMLYHVGDQRAALAEMQRALKPGGMILLATNAPDAGDVLYLAHCAAAQALGYTPAPRVTSRFHLGHLALVQQFFPDAAVHSYQDAFVFPDLDAALRYYASGVVDLIEGASPGGRHVHPLMTAVRAQLQEKVDGEGRLRVPKNAGCFVARKQ